MHHVKFSSHLPLFFRKCAHKPHFNKYGSSEQWYYLSQWVAGGDCITFLFLLEKRNSKYKLLLFYWLFVVLPFIKTQPHVPVVHLVRRSLHIPNNPDFYLGQFAQLFPSSYHPVSNLPQKTWHIMAAISTITSVKYCYRGIRCMWEHGIIYLGRMKALICC